MSTKLIQQLTEIRSLEVITLEKIAEGLKDQSIILICFISMVPFMQPIPIPGVSTLLGLVAFMQGVGLVFFEKPLLTQKMKQVTISHEKFDKIISAAEKFTKFTTMISVFDHHWTNSKMSHVICGISIMFSSAFLSLPLPIPFSNFIPAMSIALICLGLLEDDIILTVIGLSVSLSIFWMGLFSYHLILEKFPILFN